MLTVFLPIHIKQCIDSNNNINNSVGQQNSEVMQANLQIWCYVC